MLGKGIIIIRTEFGSINIALLDEHCLVEWNHSNDDDNADQKKWYTTDKQMLVFCVGSAYALDIGILSIIYEWRNRNETIPTSNVIISTIWD